MKVRIVSDGTLGGTRVFDEQGRVIEDVVAVSWRLNLNVGPFVVVEITQRFFGSDVECDLMEGQHDKT